MDDSKRLTAHDDAAALAKAILTAVLELDDPTTDPTGTPVEEFLVTVASGAIQAVDASSVEGIEKGNIIEGITYAVMVCAHLASLTAVVVDAAQSAGLVIDNLDELLSSPYTDLGSALERDGD